jgi:electron transport complex protein RnfG
MRELLKLSSILATVCAICAALLVYVDMLTQAPREASGSQKRSQAARSVLPSFTDENAELRGLENGAFLLTDRTSGEFLGAAIEGSSTHGYGGNLRLIVGFDAKNNVVDFAVLESHETPGLGAKVSDEKFRAAFRGRPSNCSKMHVKKDGGDVDAITSATISSRAACEAVADAASKLEAVRKEALQK